MGRTQGTLRIPPLSSLPGHADSSKKVAETRVPRPAAATSPVTATPWMAGISHKLSIHAALSRTIHAARQKIKLSKRIALFSNTPSVKPNATVTLTRADFTPKAETAPPAMGPSAWPMTSQRILKTLRLIHAQLETIGRKKLSAVHGLVASGCLILALGTWKFWPGEPSFHPSVARAAEVAPPARPAVVSEQAPAPTKKATPSKPASDDPWKKLLDAEGSRSTPGS